MKFKWLILGHQTFSDLASVHLSQLASTILSHFLLLLNYTEKVFFNNLNLRT